MWSHSFLCAFFFNLHGLWLSSLPVYRHWLKNNHWYILCWKCLGVICSSSLGLQFQLSLTEEKWSDLMRTTNASERGFQLSIAGMSFYIPVFISLLILSLWLYPHDSIPSKFIPTIVYQFGVQQYERYSYPSDRGAGLTIVAAGFWIRKVTRGPKRKWIGTFESLHIIEAPSLVLEI